MAIGLLAFSTILAWMLIQERRRNPLGPELVIESLSLRLRPPQGFRLVPTHATDSGQAAFFVGKTGATESSLAVWKMNALDSKDFSQVAEDVIRWQGRLWKTSASTPTLTPLRGNIGEVEGVELAGLKEGSVARIAELALDQVFVISLSARNGPINGRLYELFDRSCRSVRLELSGHP